MENNKSKEDKSEMCSIDTPKTGNNTDSKQLIGSSTTEPPPSDQMEDGNVDVDRSTFQIEGKKMDDSSVQIEVGKDGHSTIQIEDGKFGRDITTE